MVNQIPRPTTVFLGDSHLARVRRSVTMLSSNVLNLAVGGSATVDLPAQLTRFTNDDVDRIVLSIGTNDAAPWRGIGIDSFTDAFARVVDILSPGTVTYVAPPGVIESRLSADAPWSNASIHQYRCAAVEACRLRGIPVIRADQLLNPLGPSAFSRDGVHLSGVGYRTLLPVIDTIVASR